MLFILLDPQLAHTLIVIVIEAIFLSFSLVWETQPGLPNDQPRFIILGHTSCIRVALFLVLLDPFFGGPGLMQLAQFLVQIEQLLLVKKLQKVIDVHSSWIFDLVSSEYALSFFTLELDDSATDETLAFDQVLSERHRLLELRAHLHPKLELRAVVTR